MRKSDVFRSVLALAIAAALVWAGARAHGQAGPRERTLFVSAVDARGEPIEGLGPGDFVVREDGARREVLRVTRASDPIDIALLVDTSAAATGMIAPMRDALRAFIARMVPGNQIAIVGLGARPTILVDYTSDPTRLRDGVGRIFAESGSGMTLLDALVEVAAGLQRREATRAVLVPVIADGLEFSTRYHRDVIAALTRARAAMHAVTVGMFYILNDVDRERALTLDEGARRSGGQRIALLMELGIETALQRLARELSSQYKVVYGRPETLIPPETIEVSAERPGVMMRGTPARGQTGE